MTLTVTALAAFCSLCATSLQTLGTRTLTYGKAVPTERVPVRYKMPEMTAAQARALHKAGITDVEALAAAAPLEVERALCAWLPAAMRTTAGGQSGGSGPKDARAAAQRVGVTGQAGSNAVVRRSAKVLLASEAP